MMAIMAASAGTTWSNSTTGLLHRSTTSPPSQPSLAHLRAPPRPNRKTNNNRRTGRLNPSYSNSSPSVAVAVTPQSPSPPSVSISSRVEEEKEEEEAAAAAKEEEEEEEEEEEICRSSFDANLLRKRRGFIFMAILSRLVYQTTGFCASAKESDSDEALVIRGEVRKILSKAKAAGVLRLAFHDAGTFNMKENSGGMNGSIIFELDRLENAGLARSVKVLKKSKEELDKVLPDLIAVAGSEAVSLCGGPLIPVRIGRIDASIPDRPDQLPQESLDAAGLKKCFLRMGFSTQELVALSGAHTLGGKGFGNPLTFDNSYYKILLEKPWTSSGAMASMIGLPSDHALVEDDECLRWIKTYADDQAKFFDDFIRAYIKLVGSGASWR